MEHRTNEQLQKEILENWPNCKTPDCPNKANVAGGAVKPASEYCVPCMKAKGMKVKYRQRNQENRTLLPPHCLPY
jgi:hypothetical protein